ncbi:MAG: hypothetical protein LBT40_02295 [Deltaproteobacteria bacterium]|nr:hypothetical protein [Deltaproteobacteria bacterium]
MASEGERGAASESESVAAKGTRPVAQIGSDTGTGCPACSGGISGTGSPSGSDFIARNGTGSSVLTGLLSDITERPGNKKGINIYKVTSNGRVYLRIQESYRDEDGKSRTINYRNVGKVDPATGQNVYYPEFLNEVKGTDREPPDMLDQLIYSVRDFQNAKEVSFGTRYLLNNIIESIGLQDALSKAFPYEWLPIVELASYLTVTGEPTRYCQF